jgi:hypothetical protein
MTYTTYKSIQSETNRRFGFVPKTCWIADIKAHDVLGTARDSEREVTPARAQSETL